MPFFALWLLEWQGRPLLCLIIENTAWRKPCGVSKVQLDSPGHFTGTEATGAHIDVLGRTLHNRLNALHIGLPGAVGAAVRVRHLNAEHNALIAKFTLGHSLDLLAVSISKARPI